MSLKDEMNEQASQYGAGSSNTFFSFDKSGAYRFRILSKPIAIATHFFGAGRPASVCYGIEKGCPYHEGELAPKDDKGQIKKPSIKFACYVIDRQDGGIKIADLPWSVWGPIAELEEDEDYKFSGFPMPYDIKVTYDKDNKDPKQIYKPLASPNRVPLTTEEENDFMKRDSEMKIENFVENKKNKSLETSKANGSWEVAAKIRRDSIKEAQDKAQENAGPEIEYPTEEIDPKNIPF